MKLSILLGVVFLVATAVAQPQRSDLRYPPDLAVQLVSEDDVRTVTATNVRLGDVSEEAATLLVSRPIPLSDLTVAVETKPRKLTTASQWDMPPFVEIDPPPPAHLPPAAQELWKKMQDRKAPRPEVFAELPSNTSAPSALLRPRPAIAGQRRLTSEDLVIPPPFSVRRYGSGEGFFQIAVYGGTTSFAAEDAYRALRHAADQREPLQGVGREAFLTHIQAPDYVEPVAEDPHALPLSEIPVVGRPRPDLLDPGLIKSSQAPAFEAIGTPARPPKPAPKKAAVKPAEEPAKKPEVIMLVMFLPEKSVTVEMALDDRLGTVQNLIALGLLVNQKMLQQW